MRWIRQDVVRAIHEAQITEHGGSLGFRDAGLLDSALARPENLAAYGDPPPQIPILAATYALGVIQNHPFIDGNKRVGFVMLELFLNLNGHQLRASDEECVENILADAAGELGDAEFIDWVTAHSVAYKRTI